ncbi:MAG TPA: hypothetical protein VN229_16605, partial [Terriglobales bacterium]|nr:hypothetical protein [Terriglobales bacterium]
LLSSAPKLDGALTKGKQPAVAESYVAWLEKKGKVLIAARCRAYLAASPYETVIELPGPVGERNLYGLTARGKVMCLAQSETGLLLQIGAALATGNHAVVVAAEDARAALTALPADLRRVIAIADDEGAAADLALFEGDSDALQRTAQKLAVRDGSVVPIFGLDRAALADGSADYALEWLVSEHAVSTNTAAAGGNASLMAIG